MTTKNFSASKALAALLGAVMLLTCFSGCELSTNAKRSADNSEQAAGNSTKLLDLNQWAYGDGRQGGSRERRENALRSMAEAETLEAKMASAAAYFAALEFQLYKEESFREDDSSKRTRMMAEGISEVMKVQKDFRKAAYTEATRDGQGNVIGERRTTLQDSLGNRHLISALAFAGAMHKVSERQLEAAKRNDFPVKSVFDILADALAVKTTADGDVKTLSEQPAPVFEALRESDDVIALMQLRLNLFIGTGLAALGANPVGVSDGGRIEMSVSAVKLQDASDRLRAALQTKAVLAKAGVTSPLFADVEAYLVGANKKFSTLPDDSKFTVRHEENRESQQKRMGVYEKLLEVRALAAKLAK